MTARSQYAATTVLVSALAAGGVLSQQDWRRPGPPHPPKAERSAATRPAPPALTAALVLAGADELYLTADQWSRLAALARAWHEESSGLESAVGDASRRFSKWMSEAQKKGPVTIGQILRESEDVRALSASLRERRRLHAESAARVLTLSQRTTLGLPASAETSGTKSTSVNAVDETVALHLGTSNRSDGDER